ncbi:hypothetical protein SAMN05660350_03425 [Geodermatophilus obscurus]|uniref:Uncharacterized protein n=1 Tax=Geodermatophilus obscurus TaxID=1861 RepID=A0A1M7UK87_9ACTN|nr:hypothetical protein SAMN05660350_03425 [Geodermatophilus obscurus]
MSCGGRRAGVGPSHGRWVGGAAEAAPGRARWSSDRIPRVSVSTEETQLRALAAAHRGHRQPVEPRHQPRWSRRVARRPTLAMRSSAIRSAITAGDTWASSAARSTRRVVSKIVSALASARAKENPA